MGKAGPPEGSKDLAVQHAGATRVDDARLKALIQEAVDEALRAIAQSERSLEALAGEVARREGDRAGGALGVRLDALERELRAVGDRHGKVESRVDELTLHVGHREPVDLPHVPPSILERSLQAALDELTAELAKAYARDELERILDEALDDVRGRSKGSELYERAEGRIVVRGLAAAVGKRLLSAKAAQASFDELVKHLRLHAPGFHPRSLSAIIRLRSSEYAVESALAHGDRLRAAEAALEELVADTRRIEREAKEAQERAGADASKSSMEAASQRRQLVEDFQGRIQALEKRAADAEARLEKSLERLESVERYASRVEAAMIRRTKEGTFKGDFTPVIEAVHEALEDGKARTVAEVGRRVKGVDREVVEAVVREGVREGDFVELKDGKVRTRR